MHLGAGALAGLLTSAAALVLDAWRTRTLRTAGRGGRRSAGLVGITAALVVVLAVVMVPDGGPAAADAVPASPSADGGGLPALTVNRHGAPIIADSAGRRSCCAASTSTSSPTMASATRLSPPCDR